jgi:hypothetical protein
MVVADQGTVSFTLGGTAGVAYLHPTMGLVTPGISTTVGSVSTSRIFLSNVTGGSGLALSNGAGTSGPLDRISTTGVTSVSVVLRPHP